MPYCKSIRIAVLLFTSGFITLGLLVMPGMAWANRLEKIAESIAAGADQKVKDLVEVGITASLILPLLLMLYWVTEKKGVVRIVGLMGAGALGYALYMLHFG